MSNNDAVYSYIADGPYQFKYDLTVVGGENRKRDYHNRLADIMMRDGTYLESYIRLGKILMALRIAEHNASFTWQTERECHLHERIGFIESMMDLVLTAAKREMIDIIKPCHEV